MKRKPPKENEETVKKNICQTRGDRIENKKSLPGGGPGKRVKKKTAFETIDCLYLNLTQKPRREGKARGRRREEGEDTKGISSTRYRKGRKDFPLTF